MLKYVVNRLLSLIPVILVTSFLIYWAMSLTEGDPAMMIAGDGASKEMIDQIRHDLGLDQPFLLQYFNYMRGMLVGDMGKSYVTNKDVFHTFFQYLPNTLYLGGAAVIIATLVSIPLGIYTAIHQNTWKDTAGMIFALFGTSMPNFWLGLMLIIIFALHLRLFPTGGNFGWKSLVLPAVTVGFGLAALITRITRSSMLDVMRQDYMTTARAKGCSEHRVIYKHGLKNALIPIITLVIGWFLGIFSGSIMVENIFALNGVGRIYIEALNAKDFEVVLLLQMFYVIIGLLGNLVIDIAYGLADPRVRVNK